MKTGFFALAVTLLLPLVASQPHRHGHKHDNRAVEVVTETSYMTVDSENVIVYVDGHGKPVTTKTVLHDQANPTPAPPAGGKSHNPYQAPKPQAPKTKTLTAVDAVALVVIVDGHGKPVSTKTIHTNIVLHDQATPTPALPSGGKSPNPSQAPAPKPESQALKPQPQAYQARPPPPPPSAPTSHPVPPPPQPAPPKPSKSSIPAPPPPAPAPVPPSPPSNKALAPPSAPPSPGGPGFNSGVSYSPYNADNSCKSASQVSSDFSLIQGFSVIRLYGTDCNQVANVLAASKNRGISLFLGIFDLTNIASECKDITDAVKGDWSLIHTVSVGNELINDGGASVGQVTAAIGQVRSTLQAAGYHGPVVTVDTMVAMKANPELCHASDYCAINCHAFFDGNVAAEGAGPFVLDWTHQVSQAAGGKTVVVTETGWPTQGDPNNKAVPSKPNHDVAIASIKESLKQNVILYSAFNDLWKKDSGATYNAEKFWGILGNAPG